MTDDESRFDTLMKNEDGTVGLVSPTEETMERYEGSPVQLHILREAVEMAEEMGWETLFIDVEPGEYPVLIEREDGEQGVLAIAPIFRDRENND